MTTLHKQPVINQLDKNLWLIEYCGATFVVINAVGQLFRVYRRGTIGVLETLKVDYGIEDVAAWVAKNY